MPNHVSPHPLHEFLARQYPRAVAETGAQLPALAARYCGYNRHTAKRWVRLDRMPISAAIRCAEALGVHPSDIWGDAVPRSIEQDDVPARAVVTVDADEDGSFRVPRSAVVLRYTGDQITYLA